MKITKQASIQTHKQAPVQSRYSYFLVYIAVVNNRINYRTELIPIIKGCSCTNLSVILKVNLSCNSNHSLSQFPVGIRAHIPCYKPQIRNVIRLVILLTNNEQG